MQLPLRLTPRPSRRLLLAVGAVYLGAGFVLLPMKLPTWLTVAAWTALCASFLFASRRTARRCPKTLILRSDGQIDLIEEGTVSTAAIGTDTVALPWLVVLDLRIQGRRRYLPLAADALDADSHRRMRLWLRWRANAEARD